MNCAIGKRLMWKEFRQQRGFWITIFSVCVIGQFLIWKFSKASDRLEAMFLLAVTFSAFYALGCGATLFALEREEDTFETLRSLPLTAGTVFFWKTTYAMLSAFLLVALLWLVSGLWAQFNIFGRHGNTTSIPSTDQALHALLTLDVVMFLVLPWSIFFSLILKRPLHAAIASGLVLALPLFFPMALIAFEGDRFGDNGVFLLEFYFILGLLIIPVDCWLGLRWFGPRAHQSKMTLATSVEPTDDLFSWNPPSHPKMVLNRLLWQQLRESTMLATMLSVAVFLLLWIGLIAESKEAIVWLVSSLIAIQGSCVFLLDQRNGHYRFLAQQGVSPSLLWLSRHLIWLMPPLACMMATVPFVSTTGPMSATTLVGMGALAYTAGQVASLFCKRGIMAIFFGLVVSLCLFAWASWMTYIEVDWWWSVAPIPLILMYVTLRRMPRWLAERNDWRSWLRTGTTLGVPAAVLFITFALVRAYSIPRVDLGFSIGDYQLSTNSFLPKHPIDYYRKAADAFITGPLADALVPPDEPLTTDTIDWIEANHETIQMTLASSKRETRNPRAPYAGRKLLERIADLGELLIARARLWQQQGEPDNALEHYLEALQVSEHLRRRTLWPEMADRLESRVYEQIPYWATSGKQTPEQILIALRHIEKFQADRPSHADPIRCRLAATRQALRGHGEVDAFLYENQSLPISRFDYELWSRCLPWEQARALRALDRNTHIVLERCEIIETSIALGRPIPMARSIDFAKQPAPPLRKCCIEPGEKFSETDLITMIARRRAVRIVLALEAFRAASGTLPSNLEQLTPKYLAALPLEPYEGRPFTYHPDGSRDALIIPGLTPQTSWKLPPHTALLSYHERPEDLNYPRREQIFPIP